MARVVGRRLRAWSSAVSSSAEPASGPTCPSVSPRASIRTGVIGDVAQRVWSKSSPIRGTTLDPLVRVPGRPTDLARDGCSFNPTRTRAVIPIGAALRPLRTRTARSIPLARREDSTSASSRSLARSGGCSGTGAGAVECSCRASPSKAVRPVDHTSAGSRRRARHAGGVQYCVERAARRPPGARRPTARAAGHAAATVLRRPGRVVRATGRVGVHRDSMSRPPHRLAQAHPLVAEGDVPIAPTRSRPGRPSRVPGNGSGQLRPGPGPARLQPSSGCIAQRQGPGTPSAGASHSNSSTGAVWSSCPRSAGTASADRAALRRLAAAVEAPRRADDAAAPPCRGPARRGRDESAPSRKGCRRGPPQHSEPRRSCGPAHHGRRSSQRGRDGEDARRGTRRRRGPDRDGRQCRPRRRPDAAVTRRVLPGGCYGIDADLDLLAGPDEQPAELAERGGRQDVVAG